MKTKVTEAARPRVIRQTRCFLTNAQKFDDSMNSPEMMPCLDCGADLSLERHRSYCDDSKTEGN